MSDEVVVSKAGSSLSLYCQTDLRYQWCYWDHNGTQYSTTAQDTMQFSPLFQWVRTNTTCGLLIPSAQPDHAGDWRCHLADTDQEEDSMKDERSVEVVVAVEASLEVVVSGDVSQVLAGDSLEVSCAVEDPGNPPLQLSLVHERRGGERQELSQGSPVTFSPGLEDTGSAFSCVWSQTGPVGLTIYQGRKHSRPLEVLMAPSLVAGGQTEFIFTEDLRIPVVFQAKPWPQNNDIVWLLTDCDNLETGEAEEEQQIKQIQPYMDKVGSGRGNLELIFIRDIFTGTFLY